MYLSESHVYFSVGHLASLCYFLFMQLFCFHFVQASVDKTKELKLYIKELGSGKQVLVLRHSKGGVDAAAALSLYWSELKGKVAGLALVRSPYGGTPVASDILREGQIADKETRRIMELVCRLIKVLTILIHLFMKSMNCLCSVYSVPFYILTSR